MYILFQLPNGAGGQAAHATYYRLCKNLDQWSEQYQVPHLKKHHKLTVRVTFDDDKFYDFFAMTWRPQSDYFLSYLENYKFVEPMNRPE